MDTKFIFRCSLILILAFVQPLWADSTKELNAKKTSDAWLSMVDEGKYAESWQNTSSYFKNAIDADQWEKTIKSVRQPLGDILSRKAITCN